MQQYVLQWRRTGNRNCIDISRALQYEYKQTDDFIRELLTKSDKLEHKQQGILPHQLSVVPPFTDRQLIVPYSPSLPSATSRQRATTNSRNSSQLIGEVFLAVIRTIKETISISKLSRGNNAGRPPLHAALQPIAARLCYH